MPEPRRHAAWFTPGHISQEMADVPRSGPRTDKMAAAAWPAFPAMNRFGQELADTLRSA
jgi:hypothetical protein